MPVTRIDAHQAHVDLDAGALLVCAYDDPAKCAQYHLYRAIPMDDLRRREADIEKEQELIFYCA